MAFGDILSAGASIISGVGGLIGGISASNAADDAYDAQNKVADAQVRLAEMLMKEGQAGGTSLQNALKQYVQSIGQAGYYTPQQIDQLAQTLMAQRQGEESDTIARLNNMYGQYTGGAQNVYDAYRAGSDERIARYGGVPNVNVAFDEAAYDPALKEMIGDYYDTFSRSTDRTIEELFSNQTADAIRRGLDRSTYDLESKRVAATEADRLRDEDMLRAIDAASKYLADRQGLASGNQQGRLNQQTGELNRFTTGVNTDIASGSATSNLLANAGNFYSGQRGASAQELEAIQRLLPKELLTAYGDAYNMFGSAQAARTNSIDEIIKRIGEPARLRMGSAQAAGPLGSAGYQYGSMFNTQNQLAQGGFQAFGDALKTLGDTDWSKISWFGNNQSTG